MSTAQNEEPSWKSPPPPPPHIPITGGVEHLVELAWRLDRMAHELEIAARYSSADDLRAVATDLRAAARDAEQSASD